MRSKKSKKMNRGNIFGGMGSTETATFKLINMILLSVITAIVIYYTFGCRQSIKRALEEAVIPFAMAIYLPLASAVSLTKPAYGTPSQTPSSECYKGETSTLV